MMKPGWPVVQGRLVGQSTSGSRGEKFGKLGGMVRAVAEEAAKAGVGAGPRGRGRR